MSAEKNLLGDRRVCLPVDGSDFAKRSINWYINNVYRKGDFVVLVHALEAPNLPTISLTSGLSVPVDKWMESIKTNIKASEQLSDRYSYELEQKKIPHDFRLMTARSPGEGIVAACKESRIDLIVMGCRGLGAVKRALMGSVSDYVIHNCNIPCVVVKQDQ